VKAAKEKSLRMAELHDQRMRTVDSQLAETVKERRELLQQEKQTLELIKENSQAAINVQQKTTAAKREHEETVSKCSRQLDLLNEAANKQYQQLSLTLKSSV
jgi:hypothetical protein